MEKHFWNEEWRQIKLTKVANYDQYFISNYGRVKSMKLNKEQGTILSLCLIKGYEALTLRKEDGKSITIYIHKLVASHFMDNDDMSATFVLHKDYDLKNNKIANLQWANKAEKEAHQQKNPNWLAAVRKPSNTKLSETKVRLIKRKILDPNRKTKMKNIAKQFGISEMQLYRIKSGENWGHIDI